MAAMRAWVIRGGDGGGYVDEFVDQGCIGLGYGGVSDLRKLDRWAIERTLEDEGMSTVDAHASILISFLHEVVSGDVVVMPDPSRGEVVAGVIDGPYDHAFHLAPDQHRHRRNVEWIARHPRTDLPPVLADVQRQRVPLRRIDSPSIDTYLTQLRAGALGRPADQKAAPRAPRASAGPRAPRRSTTGTTRAAPAPRKPLIATRQCQACFQSKPVALFDGDGVYCRDCE